MDVVLRRVWVIVVNNVFDTFNVYIRRKAVKFDATNNFIKETPNLENSSLNNSINKFQYLINEKLHW